jgi:SAM-dependent methyltransferase
MNEFWDEAFRYKGEMWGSEPAKSAIVAKDFFLEKGISNVLVPGIGYGRNAKLFSDNGMSVTGIEISATAIAMARTHFGDQWTIYEGSVTDMPFDDRMYDGIFCYALIHLLDKPERKKLIDDCYRQLRPGGSMIFTAITKNAKSYGEGVQIGKDRFEMYGGVKMFFYDDDTIREEFEMSGPGSVREIEENFPFYLVTCHKPLTA